MTEKLNAKKYVALAAVLNTELAAYNHMIQTLKMKARLALFATEDDLDKGYDVTFDIREELNSLEVACDAIKDAIMSIDKLVRTEFKEEWWGKS